MLPRPSEPLLVRLLVGRVPWCVELCHIDSLSTAKQRLPAGLLVGKLLTSSRWSLQRIRAPGSRQDLASLDTLYLACHSHSGLRKHSRGYAHSGAIVVLHFKD